MSYSFIPLIAERVFNDHAKLYTMFSQSLESFNQYVKENKAQETSDIMNHINQIKLAIVADEIDLIKLASLSKNN